MHFVREIPWESSMERSGKDREAAQHFKSRMESNLGAGLLLRGEASKETFLRAHKIDRPDVISWKFV